MKKKVDADGKTTFIKITNKDIYESIQDLRNDVRTLTMRNQIEHKQISGRVSVNRWISTTALTLITSIILLLLKIHIYP